MKRVMLILCSVALLLSLSGCGILDMLLEDFAAVKEDGSALQNIIPDMGKDEAEEEEPYEETESDGGGYGTGTALPEEPGLPDPVQADPEALEDALFLYSWFIDASLVQTDWDYTLYELYRCDISGTMAMDLGRWGEPYSISGFFLADLSNDGIPELILKTGEVEQEFFVYTARNGVVDCTGYGYMDNQTGTDVLSRYWDPETGEYITVSTGESGSGAGNYGFVYYVAQDLSVHEAPFYTMDEYDEYNGYYTAYYYDGASVSAEEYDAHKAEFFDGLIFAETYTHYTFGENRYAVFDDASALWMP